jgi:hypothetical protein
VHKSNVERCGRSEVGERNARGVKGLGVKKVGTISLERLEKAWRGSLGIV